MAVAVSTSIPQTGSRAVAMVTSWLKVRHKACIDRAESESRRPDQSPSTEKKDPARKPSSAPGPLTHFRTHALPHSRTSALTHFRTFDRSQERAPPLLLLVHPLHAEAGGLGVADHVGRFGLQDAGDDQPAVGRAAERVAEGGEEGADDPAQDVREHHVEPP